ncbi:hypothetical protein [Fibrella aquatilis]|uniref:Lipoprotein n=1 Tax=Fibrella aquatilis TaxID=2817059 RepID=A0A939GE04_9BACT|nr:hypothetical protein [Fibrella aquatilis]MBO0934832.1 hypothetical protein [Fibrella aquatilis]
MKTKWMIAVVCLAGMLSVLAGCSGNGTNTPGILPGSEFMGFADKTKGPMVVNGKMRIERVNVDDTTEVIESRVATACISYTSSDEYTYLFMIKGQASGNTFVVRGKNKYRFVYADREEVDWLEFYSISSEYAVPSDLKFNGKPVARVLVNDPVPQSYLYILK